MDNTLKFWLKHRFAADDHVRAEFDQAYKKANEDQAKEIKPMMHILNLIPQMSGYFVAKEMQDDYLRSFHKAYLDAKKTQNPQVVHGEGTLFYLVHPTGVVQEVVSVRSYDAYTEAGMYLEEARSSAERQEIPFKDFVAVRDKVADMVEPSDFSTQQPEGPFRPVVGPRGWDEYKCRDAVGDEVLVWLDSRGMQWKPELPKVGHEGWENSLMKVPFEENEDDRETVEALEERYRLLVRLRLGLDVFGQKI